MKDALRAKQGNHHIYDIRSCWCSSGERKRSCNISLSPLLPREDNARQKVWKDLDEALVQRSHVYHLDLSRQRLSILPADIGKLNKVETCCLRENDLSEASLPEEFFDISRLRELDISYNRFKVLPACICMFLDLERINISGTDRIT